MSNLHVAIVKEREWREANGWPDDDDSCIESLLGECGKMADGHCLNAGSEYCDFDCPFRD